MNPYGNAKIRSLIDNTGVGKIPFLTNRVFILVYSFFAFLIVILLAGYFYEPRGRSLPANWWVEYSEIQLNSSKSLSLPFYKELPFAATLVIYAPSHYNKGDVLVFPRISGNQIRVYIEKRFVGQIGSDDITGNLWAHFHTFRLPEEYASRTVSIKVEITGAYDIGIREIPYILPESGNRLFLFLSKYIITHIYPFSIGSSVFLMILLFLYASADQRLRNAYLLTAAGVMFAAIYTFDFAFRESSGNLENYLLIRKILIVSSQLAAWFLLAGMEWFVRKQIPLSKLMFVGTFIAVVAVSIQGSLYELVPVSYIFAFVIHINFMWVLYLAYKNRSRMVIFSFGFFLFTALYTFLNLAVIHYHVILLQFGFLVAQLGLGLNMMQEYVRVHEDFRMAHKRSMQDPLTGASNRFILEEVSFLPDDSVVLVDLDNFKSINDTMGHDVGDRILKSWVESARENIRGDDRVVRFGGDEFILLLRELDDEVLTKIMDRIHNSFISRVTDFPVSFTYGSERIGSSLSDAILRADKKMYEKKRSKGE